MELTPDTLSLPYTVRRLQPEDAAGVTLLTKAIYGDSYTVPEMYHPERIVELNKAEKLISVVAVDPTGRVVGLLDLDRRDHAVVAESTDAMVLPEYRHHHVLERLREVLEEQARRLGLIGTYGQAVTNHVYSQRAEEHFGSRPCGVILAAEPRSFRNLATDMPQRVSEVLYFKYLRPQSGARAYVPEHHQKICGRIFEQFNYSVAFVEPQLPAGVGEVRVQYLPQERWALIQVTRIGTDTAAEISRLRRQFWQHSRTDALYLDLPLADPATPELCKAVEAVGFFFCAVGLSFASDGDVLRLQWLNVPLDTSLLQISHPFGKELVSYIDEQRLRVGLSDHEADSRA